MKWKRCSTEDQDHVKFDIASFSKKNIIKVFKQHLFYD